MSRQPEIKAALLSNDSLGQSHRIPRTEKKTSRTCKHSTKIEYKSCPRISDEKFGWRRLCRIELGTPSKELMRELWQIEPLDANQRLTKEVYVPVELAWSEIRAGSSILKKRPVETW